MHTPFPDLPTDASASQREPVIQVLDRMMTLVDVLAQERDPVTLKHLALASGLHTSTAHRILNDLVSTRLVDRVEPGRYQLGMRFLELGNIVKSRLSVRDAALEPMRALHKSTGQTVNLSVRQGDEIIYVERAYNEFSGVQVVRAIGGRAPLHLTSVGKLFLATDDPRQVRSYAMRTGLAGHTQNSITELARLERELASVRTHGFSRDDEELENGVRCIAAGIRDDDDKLVAGLSLTAPADRMNDAWIGELHSTAAEISASIGALPRTATRAAVRGSARTALRQPLRPPLRDPRSRSGG